MLKFNTKQRKQLLSLGDLYIRGDGVPVQGIYDQRIIENNGQISQTMMLTCNQGELKQDDKININGSDYIVAYINDDNSGIIDCYLNIKGVGAHGKFI